jgi:hypothetical protein
MKRVLFISPHFPPDSSAGAHRARLIAPHLEAAGWTPTVVTVTPSSYEANMDDELAATVPSSLDVVRVDAWPVRTTRQLRIGDLGLRALLPLRRMCAALCARQHYDLAYITIYPTYPAVLGPWLKRRWGLRFVLDVQDPWVGSWGVRTGPGGAPDLRSRLSRTLAVRLERHVVPAVDGITAVSRQTITELAARVPHVAVVPSEELPIGWEPRDWSHIDLTVVRHSQQPWTAAYVGTILPAGRDILRGFLRGVAQWRRARAPHAESARVIFVGSSNESAGTPPSVATTIAAEEGLEDSVDEHPARVPYFEALRINAAADLVVVLGTNEPHYTASKIFPALLARRPLLAIVHRASTVAAMLQGRGGDGVELIEVDNVIDVDGLAREVANRLALLSALDRDIDVTHTGAIVDAARADVLAQRLARLFDRVCDNVAAA